MNILNDTIKVCIINKGNELARVSGREAGSACTDQVFSGLSLKSYGHGARTVTSKGQKVFNEFKSNNSGGLK